MQSFIEYLEEQKAKYYKDPNKNDPGRIKKNREQLVKKGVETHEKNQQRSRLNKLRKSMGGKLPPSKPTGTKTVVTGTDYGGPGYNPNIAKRQRVPPKTRPMGSGKEKPKNFLQKFISRFKKTG